MSFTNAVRVACPLPAACPFRPSSSSLEYSLSCTHSTSSASTPFFPYSARLIASTPRIRRAKGKRPGGGCRCTAERSNCDGDDDWNGKDYVNEWTELTEDNESKNAGKEEDADGGKQEEGGGHETAAHRMQIPAAVARFGDPIRGMVSSASKKLQNYFENYHNSEVIHRPSLDPKPEPSEEDHWQEVFADIDERENLAAALRFQLQEAVENEDFQEAAKLKLAVSAIEAKNAVAQAFDEFKNAVNEERYSDATRLRDEAGVGLVGWWSGISEGGNDPFGQIINISPAQGRLVAKSYTARQLITASPGIPLFEVFVTKGDDGVYHQQAVCLRRDGHRGPIKIEVLNQKGMGSESQDVTKEVMEVLEDGKEPNKEDESATEPLSRLLSFLKGKIPDVKLKVFQVIAPEGAEADLPKIVKQLMDQDEDGKKSENQEAAEVKELSIENGSDLLNVEHKERSSDRSSDKDLPLSVIVRATSQAGVDDKSSSHPLRILSNLEHKSKNMFVIHVEDPNKDQTVSPTSSEEIELATTSAGSDAGDVVKVLSNSEKVPVKVLTEMGEIIKLAVSHAQRKWGLARTTSYSRIHLGASADPLGGLYVGAFGPYTSEVVQLRRKYGHWHDTENSEGGLEKLEFFEYVEAVKLTGDLSVPVGQITFRAKIGKRHCLSHRFVYPEELGVIARYKGQGRMAEPGFQNAQWVDGELVLLKKRNGGLSNGAELGFVYSMNERHILVLFNRLNLQV